MIEGDRLITRMRVTTKIILKRAQLIPNVGLQNYISRKTKTIIGLTVINICIWTIVLSPVLNKRELVIENVSANVAMVSTLGENAGASASTSGETSVLTTTVSVKESPTTIMDSPRQPAIEELIRKYFPEEPEIMIAIAKAESGQDLNPKAYNKNNNGSEDIGVFQVNTIHGYDKEWLQDPENNCKAARKVYDTQGKQAWVAYNNGNYKYNLK